MNLRRAWPLALGALVLAALGAGVVYARYEAPAEITRTAGVITQISAHGNTLKLERDDHSTVALILNGKGIAANDVAGIAHLFPDETRAHYIIGWDDCRGPGCGAPGMTFVDMTMDPPFAVPSIAEVDPQRIAMEKRGDLYILRSWTQTATDRLGDKLPVSMEYDPLKPSLRFISETRIDYARFAGQLPEALLDDPDAREIFRDGMTEDQFNAFREGIQTAEPVALAGNGRYVHGGGTALNGSGFPSAAFVIDVVQNKFLAAYRTRGDVALYSNGVTGPADFGLVVALNVYLESYGVKLENGRLRLLAPSGTERDDYGMSLMPPSVR